jgi:hypothetical protein
MRKSLLLLGAAAVIGLAALPAAADVHQLGAVNVAADRYTHVRWSQFEGEVARLRFMPQNDTVDCDHIDVTYRDGTTHEVFSGVLVRDSIETVTFPEGDSRIAHVDFSCKAQARDGARIAISALSDGDSYTEGPQVWRRETNVNAHSIPTPSDHLHSVRAYEGDITGGNAYVTH